MHSQRIILPALSAVSAALALLPCSASAVSFTDLPPQHFAHDAVSELERSDVIDGYVDGSFRPDQRVTRAEALTMIVRALHIPQSSGSHIPFSDVPADAWYADAFRIAYAQEAIDPALEAFPLRTVTLGEFFKILLRLDGKNLSRFTTEDKPVAADVSDMNAWYAGPMAWGIAAGLLDPPSDNILRPGRFLTRAHVAVLVTRYTRYRNGEHLQRAEEIFDETLQTFLEEFATEDDSMNARSQSFRLILLTYGLRDVRHTPRTESMRDIAWAAGKLLKGEERSAGMLLQQALNADPQSRKWVAAILHAYGDLPGLHLQSQGDSSSSQAAS